MIAKDTELCRGRKVRVNADNQCNELTLHFKSEWVDSPHKHKRDHKHEHTNAHTHSKQTDGCWTKLTSAAESKGDISHANSQVHLSGLSLADCLKGQKKNPKKKQVNR